MTEQEALAGIRILVAVAQADGKLDPTEREALAHALAGFGAHLPPGETVDSLLASPVDVAAEATKLASSLAKDAVFEAAVAIAMVDARTDEREQKVLAQLREALNRDDEPSRLAALLERTTKASESVRGAATPIQDPALRAKRVDALIAQTALLSGVMGMLPIPFVSEVLIVMQQDRLIRGIAMCWGHPLSRKESFALFGTVFGLASVAFATHSLVKLVPGWGSLAAGAMMYAATYGLGRAVDLSFKSEGKATRAELRAAFLHGRIEGHGAFDQQKVRVQAGAKAQGSEFEALAHEFAEGKITIEEYDARLDELVKRGGLGSE